MYTIIYGKYCHWCDKAKDLLDEKGIPYQSFEVGPQEGIPNALRGLFRLAGLKTVPQIFDSSANHIGGYEDLVKHLER